MKAKAANLETQNNILFASVSHTVRKTLICLSSLMQVTWCFTGWRFWDSFTYSYLHDHFKKTLNHLLFFITLHLMPKEKPVWFVKLQNTNRASSHTEQVMKVKLPHQLFLMLMGTQWALLLVTECCLGKSVLLAQG